MSSIIYTSTNSYKHDELAIVIGTENSTIPATLGKGVQSNTSYTPWNKLSIFVPDHLLDAYKTATNWSRYASDIHPQSEMPDEMWGDINEQLKHPEPPQDYLDWLESIGVDYYAEYERITGEDVRPQLPEEADE